MRGAAGVSPRGIGATPRRGAAALLALCLACLAPPARSAESAAPDAAELTERCVGCHNDPTLTAEDGKSMTVLSDRYDRSAHRRLDCTDCHESGLAVRHPKNPLGSVAPSVCQGCHEDEFKTLAGSVHGRHMAGDKAIKDCVACHGSPHEVRRHGDPASPLAAVNQIRTCGECHEDMMANYERSEHARALLKMGLTGVAPSCASCHGSHDIRAKTDPAAATHPANTPQTCGKCHVGILREWQESSHGALWQKAAAEHKAGDGPVCSTCHEAHATIDPAQPTTRSLVAGRCGNCHQEVSASFDDSFHGQASSLKDARAAVCADCHTPHHNLPKSDPRSSIHPANLAKTCGGCHQRVNASFVTFDPHANPQDPDRNPLLHAIWLGMTALLVGVFGFFALHDLLWLQRALVGRLRGEFKPALHAEGPHVRRFSGNQMAVHVTIVSSFLLLAATGLPLKFSGAPWAPALMAIFGGVESARFLHHLAGVVTFGYFAWHLGMLVRGWFVDKERGYFWGPRSMVPQPRDLLDLLAMFRYFLYLGRQPKFDRFTYWEKFDYLAVFWGVAIIGVSGLVLWFPTAATTVLPGWALNVAFLVHGDEALLATGFIFLFHFFHTHLRPEAFPMDPVIFTGRMPLERFEQERPLEHARLVAQGRLRLEPAPTAAELRRAHVFGYTALTIGVVLAVFIFWALLRSLH